MPEESLTIFICTPVNYASYVTPGSVTKVCEECGIEVSVSPSSQKRILQPKSTKIICINCARIHPEDKIEPLTPDQITELSTAMGKHKAEVYEQVIKEILAQRERIHGS